MLKPIILHPSCIFSINRGGDDLHRLPRDTELESFCALGDYLCQRRHLHRAGDTVMDISAEIDPQFFRGLGFAHEIGVGCRVDVKYSAVPFEPRGGQIRPHPQSPLA